MPSSKHIAKATTKVLLREVAACNDPETLISRVREVGQRLIADQPRELVVGNIVRRVLGLIREVLEDGVDADGAASNEAGHTAGSRQAHDYSLDPPTYHNNFSRWDQTSASGLSSHGASQPHSLPYRPQSRSDFTSTFTPESSTLFEEHHRRPQLTGQLSSFAAGSGNTSLFGLLSHPDEMSPSQTPGTQSPVPKSIPKNTPTDLQDPKVDIKAEVIDGIKEMLDELDVVDDQIAAFALDHIHSNEIILTHTSSATVQKFLLTAARKRKFTVIHAEAYPNDHLETHATIMYGHKDDSEGSNGPEDRWKPLTELGITVIMIPDSAVFALMSRVNKVILAPRTVLANGGLIAAAGALTIAQAAKVHQTPVVVCSGVYKLSPVYPFDIDELIEYGDPGNVVGFDEGDMVENVEVVNPIFDYVPAELVDLYITNLGGHAPSYLYRIVADHYRVEDINLS